MAAPAVSVVIPVYNEEAGLPALFARLYPALDALRVAYEVIFVNDGSRDRSAALLKDQYLARPDVTRVVLFNANYGQHTAIIAGFERVRGERVVTLDADLQNPPEEIAKLLAAMDEGHDYVGGVRRTREDAWWRRVASRAMNGLRERITRIRMTDQGCMLRAYSRDIVDAVAASREVSTYIPALAYTFAHSPVEVEVAHEERAAGESKYSLYKLIRLNFDLVTGFSLVPLQLFSLFGMFVAAMSLLLYAIVVVQRLVVGDYIGGAARAVGPRHPRVLPDRRGAVRPGARRRVRRPHLPAGARASALHDPCGAASGSTESRTRGHEARELRARCRASAPRDCLVLAPTRPASGPGPMTSAVVFAYHNVGARCLRVLLAHGIDVPLVVTHDDDPAETLWFERVADVAGDYGIARRPRRPQRGRRRRARSRRSRRTSCSASTTGACWARRCSRCRRAARSTCTDRCCRSTAGARR